LQAAEKGFRRLREAYENLLKLPMEGSEEAADKILEEKVIKLVHEFDEFMNDDFNTAKVLANMFELVPLINSIKNGQLNSNCLSRSTLVLLRGYFKSYLEDIFGLKEETVADKQKLDGVLELLIDIRKDAKTKKDYSTSDKIRTQLLQMGISLKDDKEGGVSYSLD
jgi:cysteinyl-tRNA synthetase